jgi:hypothetical protein
MSNEKLLTPVAKASYLWIFQPNKKFFPEGEYSITLHIEDTPEWKKLIDHLKGELEEYYDLQCKIAKRKLKRCIHFPWKENDEKEYFVAKNKAVGKTKEGKIFSCAPKVIGPDCSILTECDLEGKLGNGTKVKVGFGVNKWTNDAQGVGISARLMIVQIIDPEYYDPTSGFTNPANPSDTSFKPIPADWFTKKRNGTNVSKDTTTLDEMMDKASAKEDTLY